MKRMHRILAGLVCLTLTAMTLAACAGSEASGNSSQNESTAPETTVIRLARSSNGHVFNEIAREQGYLQDEGITVEYVDVGNDVEVFAGLANGTIDVASNSGTNLPLERIAAGQDLTIFGGYMLTGCMPVFAKADAKWDGIQDLVGKRMACEANLYAVSGPLRDRGYDPLTAVTWIPYENQEDRIKAVLNGDVDFGLVGTSLNYEVNSNPELKVLTYASDLMPAYSCCRVEANTEWVNNNPNTVKALLRAWIRAKAYYDSHHDETVALIAELVGESEEYVRAYMDNPHCDLNPDPMKKSVVRAWNYLDLIGILSWNAKKIKIEEHINTELYKEALDECQEKYGSENPKFYEKMQAQYARNDM